MRSKGRRALSLVLQVIDPEVLKVMRVWVTHAGTGDCGHRCLGAFLEAYPAYRLFALSVLLFLLDK